jgi:alkanesulfonate monooxygenase SsuD/methylene tetrahydromethanopterin reductase-like flavin-dependent oxidoreductase (luciferase family)
MPYPMRAKFGLSLSNRAVLFGWATLDDLLSAAQTAEASGYFDGVWVGDNLLSKPRAEALVLLSALAARTQQVRLGTICLASFPLRDPILFGIQWASLDLLSQGRTVLAVCIGGGPHDGPQFAAELDNMGVPAHERVGRLIEGVMLLRRLWREERVTHTGKYYRYTEVTLLPKPLQQPVPILIASNPKAERVNPAVVDRILRRVATYGDGWQTDATPVETFRQRFDTIRTYAERQGRDSSQLESCLHLMVNINNDCDKAYQEAVAFLRAYYGAGAVSRERTELWLAYGPPAAVIDKIHAYLEAGCTTPVLRFVAPNLHEQVQRCIEEVLPAFRRGA